MKNILVVMNETPYPLYTGGRIDSFYMLKSLKDNNYNVYLIYTYSSEKDDFDFKKNASNVCDSVISYPRKKNLKSFLSITPYFILSSVPDVNEKIYINEFLENKSIDALIINHIGSHLLGQYVLKIVNHVKTIHRMQNIETLFMFSLFKTFNFFNIKKWLFGIDTIKMFFYENKIYKSYEKIAAISNAETKKLSDRYNIKWIPPFYNHIDEKIININSVKVDNELNNLCNDKKVILLTGSFTGGFNVKSTEWFINKVLPLIMEVQPNVLFIIAGKDSDKFFSSSNNINVIPWFESIEILMSVSNLSVVMATGKGGVKLKLIEALNYKQKIVSTIDGVYGSGFEDLIPNTDDEELFCTYCINAFEDKFDYASAYSYFEDRFNCNKNIVRMINE